MSANDKCKKNELTRVDCTVFKKRKQTWSTKCLWFCLATRWWWSWLAGGLRTTLSARLSSLVWAEQIEFHSIVLVWVKSCWTATTGTQLWACWICQAYLELVQCIGIIFGIGGLRIEILLRLLWHLLEQGIWIKATTARTRGSTGRSTRTPRAGTTSRACTTSWGGTTSWSRCSTTAGSSFVRVQVLLHLLRHLMVEGIGVKGTRSWCTWRAGWATAPTTWWTSLCCCWGASTLWTWLVQLWLGLLYLLLI